MAKGAYIGVDNVARKLKKGYIGVDNVARKIIKAYIGIGGVARPCWRGGYYGTITPMNVAHTARSATTVGNYALFAGGNSGTTYETTVDTYDQSLTHTTPTALSVGRTDFAATTVGNYALFGGGYYYRSGTGTVFETTVDAYDQSLTRTIPTALSVKRYNLAATTVGNCALFGGGFGNSDSSYCDTVDAYDQSLTHTIQTPLSVARTSPAATTIGDYALFGGGSNSRERFATVDAYTA